jgi:hypothetical protein
MSPVHGFNRCNAPRHATSLVVLAGLHVERPCLVSVSFPPSTHTQAFHNHPNLIHQQHTHPPHAMSHGSASASASGSSIEHRRVSATGLHPLPDGARSSSLGVGSNIGGLGIAASPPFLPMPRQPSPLAETLTRTIHILFRSYRTTCCISPTTAARPGLPRRVEPARIARSRPAPAGLTVIQNLDFPTRRIRYDTQEAHKGCHIPCGGLHTYPR